MLYDRKAWSLYFSDCMYCGKWMNNMIVLVIIVFPSIPFQEFNNYIQRFDYDDARYL
jgi:hypothetical protein